MGGQFKLCGDQQELFYLCIFFFFLMWLFVAFSMIILSVSYLLLYFKHPVTSLVLHGWQASVF